LNPTLISEICSTAHVEDKQKIQSLIVDVLALAISESVDKTKTMQLIQKCLGINPKEIKEEMSGLSKELQLY
jgi:predicted metal-dependent TIM-barrel fold hydrolase